MKPFPAALPKFLRAILLTIVLSSTFATSHAQKFEVLHAWHGPEDGYDANSGVIEVSPGVLMGVASSGGHYGTGGIFRINSDGTGYEILKYFEGGDPFSFYDPSPLFKASNNRVYGITPSGGGNGLGVIYSLALDGSGFTVVHSFALDEGWITPDGLVEASNGRLYGISIKGGLNDGGTIYSVNVDGSEFAVLLDLPAYSGSVPSPALVETPDGRLIGSLLNGGVQGYGTLYSVDLDGSHFTVLHEFVPTEGFFPTDLILGPDGRLYGMTGLGGANSSGTIFAINGDGTGFGVLRHLTGYYSYTEMRLAVAGNRLFGPAEAGMASVFSMNLDGSDYTTFYLLYSGPLGGLTIGLDGRVYGVRKSTGFAADSLFAVNQDGSGFTTLHDFSRFVESANPSSRLTEAPDGTFFGMTGYSGYAFEGGLYSFNPVSAEFRVVLIDIASATVPIYSTAGRLVGTSGNGNGGSGFIYAVDPDGSNFTFLRFLSRIDGTVPKAPLLKGSDGRLYGTTERGGSGNNDHGTIYAIQPDGTGFVVLSHFSPSVGYSSGTALIEGTEGRLYGTTALGGAFGTGTTYAINRDGSGFTVLHSFNRLSEGSEPRGLTQGEDGRIYGVLASGGANDFGSIFAINRDGTDFTILRHLDSSSDGVFPGGPLVQGNDGRLYGTMESGAQFVDGIVFSIDPNGSDFTVVHIFEREFDGHAPMGLTLGSDGRFYGVTRYGGRFGFGTLFNLSFLPEINSPAFASGKVAVPFSYMISATNEPDEFDAMNLPAGLTVNHGTGFISDTPSQAGEFDVVIAASNAHGTGFADLAVSIAPAEGFVSLSNLVQEYDGSPKSVTVSTVPAGLATTVTYNDSTVSPTEAGSYSVVATLDDPSYYGSASDTLTILPAGLPKIIQQPQDVTVALGKNVVFTVSVSSPTSVNYQWRKNGATISGATSATLRINKVRVTDAGVYHVVVTNAVGTITSGDATLTVAAPPVITSQPVSASVGPGENVTFGVSASGAGPLSFQWRKGGIALTGATSATLALANVQSADAGIYDVVVSNSFGTVVSNTATLSVVAAGVPVITQQPQSVTVKVNRNATFSVSASSASPITYEWFKDNSSISGATSSTLKLTKVNSSDAGVYHVRVSNASGSATSDSAVLTVR